MKKTLVLGASLKPERPSYAAIRQLVKLGYEVVAIGNRSGAVCGVPIHTTLPQAEGIDTVTLYLSAANQQSYYDYILSLRPRRIIFNPGAENPELSRIACAQHIEVLPACTLVMLAIGNY